MKKTLGKGYGRGEKRLEGEGARGDGVSCRDGERTMWVSFQHVVPYLICTDVYVASVFAVTTRTKQLATAFFYGKQQSWDWMRQNHKCYKLASAGIIRKEHRMAREVQEKVRPRTMCLSITQQ